MEIRISNYDEKIFLYTEEAKEQFKNLSYDELCDKKEEIQNNFRNPNYKDMVKWLKMTHEEKLEAIDKYFASLVAIDELKENKK